MSNPLKNKCGSAGYDSSKCRAADYSLCSEQVEKGATLTPLAYKRGSLVVVGAGSKRKPTTPPFYSVKKVDDRFWFVNSAVAGICREPFKGNSKLTRSWNLFSFPSSAKPISSSPGKDDKSIESSSDLKGMFSPFFKEHIKPFLDPFISSYEIFTRGEYEEAYDELGPARTAGLAGTLLATIGIVALVIKRSVRKRASKEDEPKTKKVDSDRGIAAKAVESEKKAPRRRRAETIRRGGPSSLHVPFEVDATEEPGAEATIGVEYVLAEDKANQGRPSMTIASDRKTLPSKGNEGRRRMATTVPDLGRRRSAEASVVPENGVRPSVVNEEIDSIAKSRALTSEDGKEMLEALRKLDQDVGGGVTYRENCDRAAGMHITTAQWKTAALFAKLYYQPKGMSLDKSMAELVRVAVVNAQKNNLPSLGAIYLIEAADKLSGGGIDHDEAKAVRMYYSAWIKSKEITEPFVRSLNDVNAPSGVDGSGDRKRSPIEEDIVERLRGEGVGREEALRRIDDIVLRYHAILDASLDASGRKIFDMDHVEVRRLVGGMVVEFESVEIDCAEALHLIDTESRFVVERLKRWEDLPDSEQKVMEYLRPRYVVKSFEVKRGVGNSYRHPNGVKPKERPKIIDSVRRGRK